MKSIKIAYFLLFIILVLSAFLRFYKIDQIPVSLYWDEIAIGYSAYSIAETGRDEYGTSFPLLFKSFNDYKMPGSIYITALFVKLFGLTEFSVRVSSAFLGTLTVLITYFLVQQLFLVKEKFSKQESVFNWNPDAIGLLASFLLGISPWHLQFSRTGFEANVGLFFVIFGLWCLLKGLSSYLFYFWAILIFAISMYTYRSIFLFLPLFLLGIFIIYREQFKLKKIIIGSIIFLVLIMPLLPQLLYGEGIKRAKEVSITANVQDSLYKNSLEIQRQGNTLWYRIVYNRRLIYIQEFFKNYTSHFNPKFLFLEGDTNGRHGPRGMGLLYYWELPFLLVGLYALVKHAPNKTFRAIILLWIILAPLPASLSIPAPHALRALNVLPVPYILISMGLWFCYKKLFNKYGLQFISVIIFVALLCFVNYLYLYYDKTTRITAGAWADGYKQLTSYVFANEINYDQVVITGHYWQPYIYFLFYKKYNPELFQNQGTNKHFDKYLFGGTSWDKEQYSNTLANVNLKEFARSNNVLVVLSPEEFAIQKEYIQKLTEIKNYNNELVFIIGRLL